MAHSPPFDLAAAHRWFSAECFNRVWGYLDKSDRTSEDDETMLSLAHSSLAHWRSRDDCADQNLSVGYWLLSRVYAELGKAGPALHYGKLCLDHSEKEPPFYLGYAHEALARAEQLGGNDKEFHDHLAKARKLAAKVGDREDRELLEMDLATLEPA